MKNPHAQWNLRYGNNLNPIPQDSDIVFCLLYAIRSQISRQKKFVLEF